jgi:hypothetical protein
MAPFGVIRATWVERRMAEWSWMGALELARRMERAVRMPGGEEGTMVMGELVVRSETSRASIDLRPVRGNQSRRQHQWPSCKQAKTRSSTNCERDGRVAACPSEPVEAARCTEMRRKRERHGSRGAIEFSNGKRSISEGRGGRGVSGGKLNGGVEADVICSNVVFSSSLGRSLGQTSGSVRRKQVDE